MAVCFFGDAFAGEVTSGPLSGLAGRIPDGVRPRARISGPGSDGIEGCAAAAGAGVAERVRGYLCVEYISAEEKF